MLPVANCFASGDNSKACRVGLTVVCKYPAPQSVLDPSPQPYRHWQSLIVDGRSQSPCAPLIASPATLESTAPRQNLAHSWPHPKSKFLDFSAVLGRSQSAAADRQKAAHRDRRCVRGKGDGDSRGSARDSILKLITSTYLDALQICAFLLTCTKDWQQDQEKHEFAFDSLQLLYNSGRDLSKRRRSMTYTPFKTLTFEEFLAQYGNDPRL